MTYSLFLGELGVGRPVELYTEVDCIANKRRIDYVERAQATGFSEFSEVAGTEYQGEVNHVCKWAKEEWARSSPLPPAPTPSIGNSPPVKIASTGSGFLVNRNRVITNQHVIDSCTSISVRIGSNLFPAQVAAQTAGHDLAALSIPDQSSTSAPIRTSAALGEDILVAGFPLAGLLADDLIVTGGQVNSLAGLRNDPSLIQISAPIQPGNSGGPLLDRAGAIVGIVVSKLNAQRLSKSTGDIAQNVNFAIKPEILRLFLDANRISYRSASLGPRLEGITLAERARQFTAQVLCYNKSDQAGGR